MPFTCRSATGLRDRLDGAIDVVDCQIEVDSGLDGLRFEDGLEVDARATAVPEFIPARQAAY